MRSAACEIRDSKILEYSNIFESVYVRFVDASSSRLCALRRFNCAAQDAVQASVKDMLCMRSRILTGIIDIESKGVYHFSRMPSTSSAIGASAECQSRITVPWHEFAIRPTARLPKFISMVGDYLSPSLWRSYHVTVTDVLHT